ncbi:MAG TPA: hemerythrin domain-containing protein [Candidatus Binataceae bacterium]|nr:hemerythrin domain-containing protein [Candidatus Binataceae bacterium]
MNSEIEIEVTDLSAPDQRERVFSAVERLPAGQTLELLLRAGAGAPRLLAGLHERYGQSFDWFPVNNTADGLRALIAKRTAEPRSITGFLGADHHRLNEYWDEFLRAAAACEVDYDALFTRREGQRFSATDRLSQFIFGLRRHIRMEEDCLFPLFEGRSHIPAGSGPTAVMRAEHQEIQAILGTMETLLRAGDCATVVQTIEGLPVHPSALMQSHDAKEEGVLYPMADRLFSQADKDTLCMRMQAL